MPGLAGVAGVEARDEGRLIESTHRTEMEITKKKKIHGLAYRFSIDFLIQTLGFVFFWQKSRDFRFADFFLDIFKIHRLEWIFLWFLAALNLFLQCFILICTNIHSVKCCCIKGFL